MPTSIGRRLGAAALVLGPAAVALSSAVTPADDQPGPKTVAKFAAHPGQATALLAADVLILFMVPAFALAALLAWRRSPRLATAGAAVGLVGIAASFVLTSFDIFTKVAADTGGPDAGAFIRKVTDVPVIGIFGLTFVLGHLVGIGLVGAALWRSRVVPRWAAGAVCAYIPLGVLSFAVGGPLAAVGGLALLVGFVGCAQLLLREGVGLAPAAAAAIPSQPGTPSAASAVAPVAG